MDGTFDYCANFFKQLYTIHTYANNTYVPVVFCLLPNKRKETYVTMLQQIGEKCRKLGLQFSPTNIVVDFEIAVFSTIAEVFPAATIVGCRFYLTQSWYVFF